MPKRACWKMLCGEVGKMMFLEVRHQSPIRVQSWGILEVQQASVHDISKLLKNILVLLTY